jgi:hypothetical protein
VVRAFLEVEGAKFFVVAANVVGSHAAASTMVALMASRGATPPQKLALEYVAQELQVDLSKWPVLPPGLDLSSSLFREGVAHVVMNTKVSKLFSE